VPKAEIGARERKKRQTLGRIQEAAFRLFGEAGFDGTTVDQIAAAAGVSPRTFFRYFASKEDVVFAEQPHDLTALRAAVTSQPATSPERVALRDGLLDFSRYIQGEQERVLSQAQLVNDNPSLIGPVLVMQSSWSDSLAAALAERAGDGDPSFEQRVLASAAVGALTIAVYTWRIDPEQSLPELTRRGLETLATMTG
jgi:AcrR family transcriptional regulator